MFMIYHHTSFQDLNIIGANGAHASKVHFFAMLQLLVARNWEVCLGTSSSGIIFIPSVVKTGENYSKIEMGSTHTHTDNTVITVSQFFTFMKNTWLRNVHLQLFSVTALHGSNDCTSNIKWWYVGLCKMTSALTQYLFFSMAQQPLVGQGLLVIEASRSHSDTTHLVGLLWTRDQSDAETSTWQHNTHIHYLLLTYSMEQSPSWEANTHVHTYIHIYIHKYINK